MLMAHRFGVVIDDFSLGWLQGEIDALSDLLMWEPDVGLRVNLVLEELSVNVRDYGVVAGRRLDIVVSEEPAGLRIDFADGGCVFDVVNEGPVVDITSGIGERQPGGLGLHLVKQMVESLSYERRCGCNHVSMLLSWTMGGVESVSSTGV